MNVGFGPSSKEVAACKPIKPTGDNNSQMIKSIKSALNKMQPVETHKECPESSYGGNPAWKKYVDPKTCASVVNHTQIKNP